MRRGGATWARAARGCAIALTLPALALTAAVAQDAVPPSTGTAGEAAPLEEVLVTGTQPGPGLWHVRRTDNGHVLWILGSYSPLPRRMEWRSRELEAVIAVSQVLIAPPSVDAKVGPLGGLSLLPSLVGVRDNPGGARLADVVPPELYARWQPLKARFLGRKDDVEGWRPIFAAQELWYAALRETGLVPYGVVWPSVEKLARKARIDVVEPEVRVRVERPREAIREFKQGSLDDLDCFAKTVARLESDLGLMRVRANAWAEGDLARLRELAPVNAGIACIAALLDSSVIRERGLGDLPERSAAAWLEAAESALARHPSTVAVLPIERLLAEDGYLARLRARGYEVVEP
jgi:hypothetical protein